MSAAVKAKYVGDKSPAVAFLKKLEELISTGKYHDAAESFKKFDAENETSDFLVEEAIPFRVQNHLTKTIGATAFVKYTLRNPTWATELSHAFHDPSKFDGHMAKIETDVKKLAA
ncbi:MAG: hypothetical protein K2W78_13660 [Xanthobacteraceae bacterium]|nr:hypothetical protein [Xanthobacteraceae bacterium]